MKSFVLLRFNSQDGEKVLKMNTVFENLPNLGPVLLCLIFSKIVFFYAGLSILSIVTRFTKK